MNIRVRYHILTEEESGRVLICDAHTGRVQYPTCWQDISAYYHYLLGRGRIDAAQSLLAEAMSGTKPMTRMVQEMSRPAVWSLDMSTYVSSAVHN